MIASVLLAWRVIFGRTSLSLERLRSLYLFLKDIILSLLSILDLLLDVDLQILFGHGLLFPGALNCDLDFFRVGLGFLDSVI